MLCSDFVKETIVNMQNSTFKLLKKDLMGQFLLFNIIGEDDVSKKELSEKICDYFEKVEIKTYKSFDKHIEIYTNDIDSIVKERIKEIPQPKKKDPTPIVEPRARKYYNKAKSIISCKTITVQKLIDFSRIMFCLYTEIIKNNGRKIDSLDYSAKVLIPRYIILSMKAEIKPGIGKNSKLRFNIQEKYSSDTCTFIIAQILLYAIVDSLVEGEYYHE